MTRRRVCTALALAVVVLGSTPRPGAAQVATGTVSGTVKDSQGAVIPGATVTLTNERQGTSLAPALTSNTGDYVFPNVPTGTYTVEVAMAGFTSAKRTSVAVSAGDRVSVQPFTLDVAGAAETVSVKAEAPLVQSQSGERSFTITADAVENLPILNRTFSALASLAPGMSNSGGTNPARLGGGGANNAMFDGIGIIDTGSNSIQLTMNMEAVGEVKVLVSNYQAEYGRSSGVQISAVTKSGTNQFRGSVYDIQRNSDWNSNSWLNKQNGNAKTISKEKDWGYSIGGPVGKPGGNNKLFFFFSQEWRPRTTGGQVTRFRVPTELERQGDFSQSRDNNGALFPYIRDYTTGLAVQRRQYRRLLPGWRRDRQNPAEPALRARPERAELLAAAERQRRLCGDQQLQLPEHQADGGVARPAGSDARRLPVLARTCAPAPSCSPRTTRPK